jgi:formylglycine-generating enzyme required for sulfatase activity
MSKLPLGLNYIICFLACFSLPVHAVDDPQAPANPSTPAGADKCDFCLEMVKLPKAGISIGKYEVTQAQWRSVMGDNPSMFPNCGDNCPVEQVSWDDVQTYIERLNQKTGKRYRLPTEEEWFAGCQAGQFSEYCGVGDIDALAWYRSNSGSSTHPVGQKGANAYGLYDMTGNVWEWTSSCWDGDCANRVYRGGPWNGVPAYVRSTERNGADTAYRSFNLGLRLILD